MASVRVTVIAVSFLVAIPLLAAGLVFGLNGAQWSWWQYVAWLSAAVVSVGGVFLVLWRRTNLRRRQRLDWRVSAALGGAVAVVSLAAMSRNYSDPSGGPMFWPHFLAVPAFVGVVIAEASLVVGALHDDPVQH